MVAFIVTVLPLLLLCATDAALATFQPRQRVSVVTGSNGYVGREVVHALRNLPDENGEILCLVRPARVQEESAYWTTARSAENGGQSNGGGRVRVLPYDMLDGGTTLSAALDAAYGQVAGDAECCVYHIASVFGPTEDHERTALDNVCGAVDSVRTVAKYPGCRLVLTSSMAAVRASEQTPRSGKYYTHEDWNTMSKLGANWGQSYQWSKTESERRVWELAEELNVPFTSLCPSFVFGPPSDGLETQSFSITLVGQWVRGESPVQSRLCVDVRDVAKAHVAAGTLQGTVGKRFIVSSEARVPSVDLAEALKRVARDEGMLVDTDTITADTEFDGGAIKIGTQEVSCADQLRTLRLVCRPVLETISDMGKALLEMHQRQSSVAEHEIR